MRLILMGTGPFAVPTFDWLARSPHEISVVVTRPVPDKPGRRKGAANPVLDAFTTRGIPILSPPDVNDSKVIAQLRQLAPDLLVVCDYGQILSRECLTVARLGGVNLHGSLLPKYRGAAPVNWAIWNGDAETGVTVIHMSPRLDSGPCLVQRSTPIAPDEDAVQLESRLAELGVAAVSEALAMLESWDGHTPLGVVQDPAHATQAPRLKKSDGNVDWAESAVRICNQVRALRPWPGTFTSWPRAKGPLRLILQKVSVASGHSELPPAEPGCIVESSEDRLVVATGDGFLALHEVQPAGKRVLTIREFLRGYPAAPGDRLGEANASR